MQYITIYTKLSEKMNTPVFYILTSECDESNELVTI